MTIIAIYFFGFYLDIELWYVLCTIRIGMLIANMANILEINLICFVFYLFFA